MAKTKDTETTVAPQGSVIEPSVDLSPTAGYEGHYPVQFSDETDAMFAGRVAMFEGSLASARAIQAGGLTLAQAKDAATARYEAELANLDVVYKVKPEAKEE